MMSTWLCQTNQINAFNKFVENRGPALSTSTKVNKFSNMCSERVSSSREISRLEVSGLSSQLLRRSRGNLRKLTKSLLIGK